MDIPDMPVAERLRSAVSEGESKAPHKSLKTSPLDLIQAHRIIHPVIEVGCADPHARPKRSRKIACPAPAGRHKSSIADLPAMPT
jgi:hypothetical protein